MGPANMRPNKQDRPHLSSIMYPVRQSRRAYQICQKIIQKLLTGLQPSYSVLLESFTTLVSIMGGRVLLDVRAESQKNETAVVNITSLDFGPPVMEDSGTSSNTIHDLAGCSRDVPVQFNPIPGQEPELLLDKRTLYLLTCTTQVPYFLDCACHCNWRSVEYLRTHTEYMISTES